MGRTAAEAGARPATLRALKAAGWASVPVKEELRQNCIARIRSGRPLLEGLVGYDETVGPGIENALLARHDFLLLGLRGQAKSRILRMLAELLDEAIPAVAGCEIRDDPLKPACRGCRERLEAEGDDLPLAWVGRGERFVEKLATPDVTVADLVGDVDFVKVAQGRALADERTIHFGLLPRANRGVFAVNELPDLPPRIQVALFNALQERDLQIKGFPIRLPLDLLCVFTANPEDYTNRGRIVTPLKDRIGSVIRTHPPRSRAEGIAIAEQNAWTARGAVPRIEVPPAVREILEEVSIQARKSPHVSRLSGVSARVSIANLEAVHSNAERRCLRQGEPAGVARVTDLRACFPATRGKLELEASDETEDEDAVLDDCLKAAVKAVFDERLDAEQVAEASEGVGRGDPILVSDALAASAYAELLAKRRGLRKAAERVAEAFGLDLGDAAFGPGRAALAVELLLEGLHVNRRLNREIVDGQGIRYR